MSTKMKLLTAAIALCAIGVSGCATTVRPSTSAIAFEKKPREATSNPVGSKKGKACKMSILSLPILTFGEKGYYKAAKNGGVKKIGSVSDQYTQFLFLYIRHCTIVTGT